MAVTAKRRILSRIARHERVRKSVKGTSARPRLTIRRTLTHMVAQIIDDETGKSLIQLSTTSKDFQQKSPKQFWSCLPSWQMRARIARIFAFPGDKFVMKLAMLSDARAGAVPAKKRCNIMTIIAIESALDVAIMFGDVELAEVYSEALEEAGVHYESPAKCWA